MSRSGRAAAWDDLARSGSGGDVFDPDQLADLPEAAQRFLGAALSPGIALTPVVRLEMEGEIKLKVGRNFVPARCSRYLAESGTHQLQPKHDLESPNPRS